MSNIIYLLVYFPADESTAVVANKPNIILAGNVCKRGTISVRWTNGASFKGIVVDFSGKPNSSQLYNKLSFLKLLWEHFLQLLSGLDLKGFSLSFNRQTNAYGTPLIKARKIFARNWCCTRHFSLGVPVGECVTLKVKGLRLHRYVKLISLNW